MIKRFEVENYRGFNKRFVFDLDCKRDYENNQDMVKNNLINKGIIYGRNGSGKSNLGYALFDITLHLLDAYKEPTLLNSVGYRNLDNPSVISSFKYVFQFGKDEVIYEYTKNGPLNLETEKLIINGKTAIDIDYSNLDNKIINIDGVDKLDFTKIQDNHISIIKYIYANTLNGTNPYIQEVMDFVQGMLWFKPLSSNNELSSLMGKIDEQIIKKNKVKDLEYFIQSNGVNLKLKAAKNSLGNSYISADFSNGSIPLGAIASNGTLSLILTFYWYMIFSKVSFLFVDGFDSYLHYVSSENVFKKFKSTTNMQTIVTTHNLSLMNNTSSRPDCCFILDNNKIRCLSDSTKKEIRLGHNLEKMYKNGAFD